MYPFNSQKTSLKVVPSPIQLQKMRQIFQTFSTKKGKKSTKISVFL